MIRASQLKGLKLGTLDTCQVLFEYLRDTFQVLQEYLRKIRAVAGSETFEGKFDAADQTFKTKYRFTLNSGHASLSNAESVRFP